MPKELTLVDEYRMNLKEIDNKRLQQLLFFKRQLIQQYDQLKEEYHADLDSTFEFNWNPFGEKTNRLYVSDNELNREIIRGDLNIIKEELTSRGLDYTDSIEEKQSVAFNECLPDVAELTLSLGGYFGGVDVYRLRIKGERVIMTYENHVMNVPVHEVPAHLTKKDLLSGLKKFKVGEWPSRSINRMVMDGTQWSMDLIDEKNEEIVSFSGSNAYPYNFFEWEKYLGLKTESDSDDEIE